MKSDKQGQFLISNLGVEWAALTAMPLPLLLISSKPSLPLPQYLISAMVAAAIIFIMLFAYFIINKPNYGKISGIFSLILVYILSFPLMDTNPIYTLIGNVFFLGVFFLILDMRVVLGKGVANTARNKYFIRAYWSSHTLSVILLVALLTVVNFETYIAYIFTASFVISLGTFLYWAYLATKVRYVVTGAALLLIGLLVVMFEAEYACFILLVLNILVTSILYIRRDSAENGDSWWDVLLSHPARVLFSSFFILCLVGTVLLLIPAASAKGDISFINAAFTSVSAVCVTGLIVLDTPNDFSLFGQGVILLLIQLGGLGIMSITTIAIQSFGKRISLRHETMLTSMTETDHQSLVSSLSTILKYTFILEIVGAIMLSFMFLSEGDILSDAVWRGVFTAVSAFCNAGFALQSDSLIGYSGNPLILNTVAFLIFFGGISPAAAILIPAWMKRRNVPLTASLTLTASVIMVVAGAVLLLAFEWDTSLKELGVMDKLWNALFQSVTLRTAGFNSIDISHVTSPSMIIMLVFMFIGGSPGGTAGGVKTTTISVLILTFYSNITNRQGILFDNKKISQETINKAITIIISGFIVWFIAVLMIEVTQQISPRDLIFEVTSAIGTVGLSVGATAQLDEIGKLIIMITMFAGRIGPMTLFTFLNKNNTTGTEYLERNVTLT